MCPCCVRACECVYVCEMCDWFKFILLQLEYAGERYVSVCVQFLFYAAANTYFHGDSFVKGIASMVSSWVETYPIAAILCALAVIEFIVELRLKEHRKRDDARRAEVQHAA